MARKTFFSFHYSPDVQRAQVVRRSQFFKDHGETGFYDASAFEKTKNEDPAALKRFLIKEIDGTSVICVLIGAETASRRWVRFEILQALCDARGLVGIRIHLIAGFDGKTVAVGDSPFDLLGVFRKDDAVQVIARKTVNDPWAYTSDFGKQELKTWPYTPKLPPPGSTPLSQFFSVHTWTGRVDRGRRYAGRLLGRADKSWKATGELILSEPGITAARYSRNASTTLTARL